MSLYALLGVTVIAGSVALVGYIRFRRDIRRRVEAIERHLGIAEGG
jgi:hypothetical protein